MVAFYEEHPPRSQVAFILMVHIALPHLLLPMLLISQSLIGILNCLGQVFIKDSAFGLLPRQCQPRQQTLIGRNLLPIPFPNYP